MFSSVLLSSARNKTEVNLTGFFTIKNIADGMCAALYCLLKLPVYM